MSSPRRYPRASSARATAAALRRIWPVGARRPAGRRWVVLALAASAVGLTGLSPGGASAAAVASGARPPTGRYVVRLTEPPLATYQGGVAGLAAPRRLLDQPLDAALPEARAYQGYLRARQDAVLRPVGARAVQQYTVAVNGFAALLSVAQATALAGSPGVASVTKDLPRRLQTTTTPQLLGLSGGTGVWAGLGGVARAGEGVVVGMIDSGIWPENPSFAGAPLLAAPSATDRLRPYRSGSAILMRKSDGAMFHGTCQPGEEWTAGLCTTKIIGARYFDAGFAELVPRAQYAPSERRSARDGEGHGSHTAATAAGTGGVAVTIRGRALGRASGMAPAASIAVYKACWQGVTTSACMTSDLLEAIDAAVGDGVDVINYSIGGIGQEPPDDPVEMALLSAASAGIFVAAAAGNGGPDPSTVEHAGPWVTSVAASTAHHFEGTVVLGNGVRLRGTSLNDRPVGPAPLVRAADAARRGVPAGGARLCGPQTLAPSAVSGKIVVCNRGVDSPGDEATEVRRAGGIAMVLLNTTPDATGADVTPVPSVGLDVGDQARLDGYAATRGATASLLVGDRTGRPAVPVPQVAGFSARGPADQAGGDVLKPDLTAPGADIVAAAAPPANLGERWALYSGTSMSSPHVAGLAALLMARFPAWSPMAVKSALMTTARDPRHPDGRPDTDPLRAGAGFVDPHRMLSPALVYDSSPPDWLRYLAGQGVRLDVPGLTPIDPSNLNQASISVGALSGQQTVMRTVTAVAPGTYLAQAAVAGMDVSVRPSVLVFTAAGQRKQFSVTFTRRTAALGRYATGYLTWSGAGTTVRSPVAVRPIALAAPAEVSGGAGSGRLSFLVTPGRSGTFPLSLNGLVDAVVTSGRLQVGPVAMTPNGNASTGVYRVTVPAGTSLTRVEVRAAQPDDDLDLYLVPASSDDFTPSDVAATPAGHEVVDLADPAPGDYYALVNAYSAGGSRTSVPFAVHTFLVGRGPSPGSTVWPDPIVARAGEPQQVTVSWRPLTAGRPHLGWLGYAGTDVRTILSVG